jgi:hypothetical protein
VTSRREIADQWFDAFYVMVVLVVADAVDRCVAVQDEGEARLRGALSELVLACNTVREWFRINPCPVQIINTVYERFICKLQSTAEMSLSMTWVHGVADSQMRLAPDDVAIVAKIGFVRDQGISLEVQIGQMLRNFYYLDED